MSLPVTEPKRSHTTASPMIFDLQVAMFTMNPSMRSSALERMTRSLPAHGQEQHSVTTYLGSPKAAFEDPTQSFSSSLSRRGNAALSCGGTRRGPQVHAERARFWPKPEA